MLKFATAALSASAFALVPGAGIAQSGEATTNYRATLQPLNNSGASGSAMLRLSADGKTLTVQIMASGLEKGGAHISHIHGLSSGGVATDSTCPTMANDTDGDGFVELAEGAAVYGPILVDFMNVDPDMDGKVNFKKTFTLTPDQMATPLTKRHIVIHGLTVPAGPGEGTTGEVNGTNGYLDVLPVLCGEISQVGNGPKIIER
jgi:hypothetical protein